MSRNTTILCRTNTANDEPSRLSKAHAETSGCRARASQNIALGDDEALISFAFSALGINLLVWQASSGLDLERSQRQMPTAFTIRLAKMYRQSASTFCLPVWGLDEHPPCLTSDCILFYRATRFTWGMAIMVTFRRRTAYAGVFWSQLDLEW